MMKSQEEEADHELGKRLQQKFNGFKAPVSDRVRENVFAALGGSSGVAYWVPRIGAAILLVALIIGYVMYDATPDQKAVSKIKNGAQDKKGNAHSETMDISERAFDKPERKSNVRAENLEEEIDQNPEKANEKLFSKRSFSSKQNVILRSDPEKYILTQSKKLNAEIEPNSPVISGEKPIELALLSSIDSIHLNTLLKKPAIPHFSSNTSGEIIKKSGILDGVRGVFSATLLQTFQLVNLSQATSEHIQNFRFAPLLSSRSLSYKVTAGIEKKHTRLSLSYAYLRNWNEYEIGTNQVVATRIQEHQYHMVRMGERHVEDDRLHLLGIGIQQKIMLPQHILKGYSVNVGAEYTRLMPDGQNLVWGNVGFYKQIYQSAGIQFEVGPYGQYSFIEREIPGQIWKFRPYQVGVSFHVKMK